MEFLKEILGEELFNQFASKVNEYNGNEANKDKQVKLANLATGEYVGKGKHDALAEQLAGKQSELDAATKLIADLKAASKGNEDMQGKITAYEGQIQQLQTELAEAKANAAVKVALLAERAIDVDYLMFKLNEKMKEKGETLELDENDNIKNWDSQLSGLKTQFPNMFEGSTKKKVDPNRLPDGDPNNKTEPKSLAEALEMQYEGTGE